jgi:hypothetical protein
MLVIQLIISKQRWTAIALMLWLGNTMMMNLQQSFLGTALLTLHAVLYQYTALLYWQYCSSDESSGPSRAAQVLSAKRMRARLRSLRTRCSLVHVMTASPVDSMGHV